jgi:radical SAM protein
MLCWEITRACDLACAHCRAEAIPHRDPRELSTLAACGFLRQVRDFGAPLPHVVITGGDPLKRPDLFEIVREGVRQGMQVSVAPSATDLLTREALARLQQAGMSGISLSLDGSTAHRHDRLRGVAGCFDRTVRLAQDTADLGLPLQINTLVSAETLADLPTLFGLVRTLGIWRWSLFFLIVVGRGRPLRSITPEDAETLCHWLFSRALESSFLITTTEAPFYRRVATERMQRAGLTQRGLGGKLIGRTFGIRDGNGILFVSHVGEIYPSGFLPVCAGNVRESSVVDLYRHAPLFEAIRDVTRYKGKCGRCLFNAICGGSRARAFAHTGDYLASDPLCPFQPDGITASEGAVR